MTNKRRFAKIAISGPKRKSFTYEIPDYINNLKCGQRVIVPFGRSKKTGFFMKQTQKPTAFKTKKIQSVFDNESFLSQELFNLCSWIADYYFANPADCFNAALPPFIKRQKPFNFYWGSEISFDLIPNYFGKQVKEGKKIPDKIINDLKHNSRLFKQLIEIKTIIQSLNKPELNKNMKMVGYQVINSTQWDKYFSTRRIKHSLFDGVKSKSELLEQGWSYYAIKKAQEAKIIEPVYKESITTVLKFIKPRTDVLKIRLNSEQSEAVDNVLSSVSDGFRTFLLHGITGSGKTIVYTHITREIITQNKTVLVMTPEIALTGSTLAYFRGFFGDIVTVIHSSMTELERTESWTGIKNGKYKIVIGPRSALFAPLPDLGLIIVDEEHDHSYKQQEPAPRFHGRDAAIMRAKFNNIPIILGSASPSVESYYNVKKNKYHLLELKKRPGQAILPEIKIVNMNQDRIKGEHSFLSFTLKKDIEKRFNKKEQVILYLNRRGFSRQLKCNNCGHIPSCPECNLRLTYHKVGKKLTCHYCGHIQTEYNYCINCKSSDVQYQGIGTQKVEEKFPIIFPDANISRFDSDTAFGQKNAYEILNNFAQLKSNLLLGTQMVTKGLDLPNVTLVGILSGDMNLGLPDFRASEKVFAQLLQVAGRSGRAEKRGEVLIQTFNPDNPIIKYAAKQDYLSFYKSEIFSREEYNYPPFVHLINFIFSSEDEELPDKAIVDFIEKFKSKNEKYKIKMQLLGPGECALYRLRGQFRRHFFIKTNQIIKVVNLLSEWEDQHQNFSISSKVKITIDVDPSNMM